MTLSKLSKQTIQRYRLGEEDPDCYLTTGQQGVQEPVSQLSLIDLILSLPASTTECERGFSALKATKSDWRSRLKADTLSDLLTVQLHSPDVEDFNPKAALELWAAPTPRRASFMRSSTVSKEEIVGDSEEEEEDEEEEVESEVEESEKMDEPTTSATPDEFFW